MEKIDLDKVQPFDFWSVTPSILGDVARLRDFITTEK
jgi:hypothetical protein